jgi:hypothetical protein
MEEFLLRLQDSDFGVWVSSAPTLLAYPTILMLHTVGLALVVGPAAVLDIRVLGYGSRMPMSSLSGVFRVMWIGFLINASTGLALFVSEADEKGMKWIFWVKLMSIATALIVTSRLKRAVYGGTPNTGAVSAGARGLAVASLVLWFGAIASGRLMAYIK